MGMDYGKYPRARRIAYAGIKTALAFAVAFAVAASGSCSRDKDSFRDAQPAVIFSAKGDQAASRGTIVTELRKIGVFGYSHMGLFEDNSGAWVPDFFLNQAVTDLPGNGTWTYSGARKYWPQDGRYVSFFAYAPFQDVQNNFTLFPSSSAQTGLPTIGYTVPTAILNQIDLIYGNSADMTYGSSPGGIVELTMKHALTRVDFVVKLDANEKGRPFVLRFNELTVRNVAGDGILDLSKSISAPKLWTTVRPVDDSGWASYTLTPGGHGGLANLVLDARVVDPAVGQINPWTWNRLIIPEQYLMLIPQDLGDTTDDLTPAEVVLKYTYTNVYSGEVFDIEEVIPLARPMLPAWVAGGGVTYQLNISLLEGTAIEFEIEGFIDPTPWVDQNGDNPVTGTVG